MGCKLSKVFIFHTKKVTKEKNNHLLSDYNVIMTNKQFTKDAYGFI